ncbi:MAG: CBS domain-containing protein [Candidatus Nitrosopelagicus sp.]|jgi:CBS domain-containing protein|nr:CBS domain-containing protein [Candidatus Nitrosopelagicus sp.]MBT4325805.1 CBS domain-containing protein [Candidatus Nitrosopelagicus sp.]MBT4455375.1 CBS domain-containing protein [Candidatus Nitrosopelagicus sp.]|tara:strand:+ start:907 stop:1323 length:417 start_codon:yes stop_codon:yes gene_type:complete
MGQIRDIMEKDVITIENDKTAQDAAKIIAENDISFLVVMNDGIPQGVLSESDFVRRIAVEDKKSSEVLISEIMSYKFRSVGPTTTIEDAIQKMLNKNIRRLLVLDNEKLVGVVTQTDLASYLRDQLLVDGTIKSISND